MSMTLVLVERAAHSPLCIFVADTTVYVQRDKPEQRREPFSRTGNNRPQPTISDDALPIGRPGLHMAYTFVQYCQIKSSVQCTP